MEHTQTPPTHIVPDTAATHLFVAIPVYNEPGGFALFTNCVEQLLRKPPCSKLTKRMLIGDSHPDRARNNLVHEFLQSEADQLLFIDCDLLFSPDHVRRLLSHDADVVAGCYHKKHRRLVDGVPQFDWVLNAIEGEHPDPVSKLQRIAYAGTGFLKIHRRVFQLMIDRMGGSLLYNPDNDEPGYEDKARRYGFFNSGIYTYPDGHRRWLSEDWYFCQRCADLGIAVYADTAVILKHMGVIAYPVDDPSEHQDRYIEQQQHKRATRNSDN